MLVQVSSDEYWAEELEVRYLAASGRDNIQLGDVVSGISPGLLLVLSEFDGPSRDFGRYYMANIFLPLV